VFYFFLLMPGLLACMSGLGAYPPLDDRPAMGWMVGLFVLPFALQILSFLRKNASDGTQRFLKAVFMSAGLGLVVLAAVLFLNGRMDRSVPKLMRAQVMRKVAAMGRREAQNRLIVTSWRPGRTSEDLNVGSVVFHRATVGRIVVVEVHQGHFGYPWVGRVSPE
jgi:hypothetical protein